MAKEKDKMKKIIILSFLISSLFGQVNRILDVSPTAHETSLGNQSLYFRSPAHNFLTKNDSLSQVTFTRMDWLTNITDGMTYNYVEVNWKDFDFSATHMDYGERHTDEMGVILRNFSQTHNTLFATLNSYKDIPMKNTFIGFGGKFIKHDLYLEKGGCVIRCGFIKKIY